MSKLKRLQSELYRLKNSIRAKTVECFFKTGSGGYAEGDVFLGIRVPDLRRLAKGYDNLSYQDLKVLLSSSFHEERMLALIILVNQYKKAKEEKKIRREVYQFFLSNKAQVNNWDLVDISVPHIVGAYLFDQDRSILFKLAESQNLWDRRIAIVSTFYFIRQNDFKETLRIAKKLLSDTEDLIQKAVGWMLREVGKRDFTVEETFIEKYHRKMPRTMLRYAIERFPESKRLAYLKRK